MTTKESAAIPTLQNLVNPYTAEKHGAQWQVAAHAWDEAMISAQRILAATVQPVPGPILSDERIVELAAQCGNAWHAEFYHKFARAIESDLRATLAAVPGQSEPVAAPKGVTLEAFQAAHDKQWHVVVKHPFGTSWVRMADVRDVKLAELIAAQPAPVSGATSDELHTAIMNLPHRMPITKYAVGTEALVAYKEGHRDARHAAGELVLAAPAGPVVAPDPAIIALKRIANGTPNPAAFAQKALEMIALPAPQAPDTPVAPKRPLKRCAAGGDGDCTHPDCPQLRDNEPHATGRHCPIDTSAEDEQ